MRRFNRMLSVGAVYLGQERDHCYFTDRNPPRRHRLSDTSAA
jgi:hypothetical protein